MPANAGKKQNEKVITLNLPYIVNRYENIS